MMAYVAPVFLKGGADLVCTSLMLALFCHRRLGRPFGQVLSAFFAFTFCSNVISNSNTDK